HESDWSPAPLSIKHQGDQVIVSAHQEWPNVVSVFGPRFGRLDLLVVPPYTEPTHAYNVVTAAASVNDASTPDQLLGITRRADAGSSLSGLVRGTPKYWIGSAALIAGIGAVVSSITLISTP